VIWIKAIDSMTLVQFQSAPFAIFSFSHISS